MADPKLLWRGSWTSAELASKYPPTLVHPHKIDYRAAGAPTTAWYLNFADPHVFAYYGGPLFAQDEMQVAEHPALASVRSAMAASADEAAKPLTAEGPVATPVLVRNVERRCRVDTEPNPAEGRPHGLYGNVFARSDTKAIRRATTRLDPAPASNIIAMAAGEGGSADEMIDGVVRHGFMWGKSDGN